MNSRHDLTPETLGDLLSWLGPSPDEAGRRYELIRRGLIKIFTCRGCREAEELADETINRVALKSRGLAGNYTGDPAHYFYGVAKKVFLEHLRKRPNLEPLPATLPNLPAPEPPDEREFDCLEQCMAKLSAAERDTIRRYYQKDADGALRESLARRLGIKINTLRVRVFRTAAALEECVNQCLGRDGAA